MAAATANVPVFDSIGHDPVVRAGQSGYAGNDEPIRANSVNPRAHGGETVGEIAHFRFTCRILKHCFTVRQGRGHHEVFRRPDRDFGEPDGIPRQAVRRARLDIPVGQFDFGTEFSQTCKMEINRSRADGTAPRQRDPGLADPCHERSKDEYRCAHFPHQIVRRGGLRDIAGRQIQDPPKMTVVVRIPLHGDLNAQGRQQVCQRADIHEVR